MSIKHDSPYCEYCGSCGEVECCNPLESIRTHLDLLKPKYKCPYVNYQLKDVQFWYNMGHILYDKLYNQPALEEMIEKEFKEVWEYVYVKSAPYYDD